ncbi:hypothetical protein A3K63_01480 [Candidatus Micrarchaeota archaeon RBG_16_49_10]|nr:MAG: hypothetical protein A3K63_01480 [Candidatus Micrarchaeota archaeon RBG_16_49_10]
MGGCINSSNPDDCYDTCYDSVSSRMVENAVRNGTIVTVAVGNCGPNPTSSCQESGNESISWPSCARGAISVGNTNDNDVISSSSSRGPTDGDSRTKPDLTATGVSVNSTSDGLDSYQTASGTSQSTPFVVGASALIAQKYNETFGYFPSPARVKSILLSSANTTGMRGAGYSQRNDVYGSGRLDIEESLRVINYTRNGTVSTGESRVYRINVSGETRVTLVWDEGITDSNDLNLVVGNLSTNFTNPSSGSDNVEGVIVSNPASGYWTVYVLAANSTNQPFELASNMEIFDDLTPPSLVMESPQNRTYRYNVSIHINFSTDGTNQTIWYDFNGTPETITGNGTFNISSEGTYTFTLSTNDSYDNVNSSSVTLTYIARPGISEQSVDRPVILPNETVNVTAIIDDENLNETLVSITFPNSSEVTAQMVNGSRYYFEFNQTGQYGRYNVTILANDTEGNEANASLQFDVKLPANFSMSASENISFFLLYEGTENQRDSATNSTFYFIVPESLWDMEANTSELTLHFYSANISGSTDSTLSISNVSGQVASQTTLVKGFAVNLTGLDFSLSNMTFAFNQSLVNNASNLLMYKCSDWNGTCQGSWTNDTADSAFNATIGDGNVSIVTEGYSAFALVETIQAATTTTISTTTAPSSGDSGATSSSNTTTSTSTVPQTTSTSSTTIPETTTVAGAYCGDQACQPNENCTSCYADCRCDDKRATIFETASPVKRKIFFALLILAVISIFLILFRLGVRDRIGRLTQKTKPKFKYDP